MDTTERPTIVVGLDGSDSSIDALRWAGAQAASTGMSVEVVTTWEFPPYYGGYYSGGDESDWPSISKTTQDEALKRADLPDGITVTGAVVEGHPAAVLKARSSTAALLVVGSRGHGGFTGLLLGSVSGHLAEHSTSPVVVVHHRDTSAG